MLIDPLEARVLLSFAAFGEADALPLDGTVTDIEIAAAADGQYIAAAHVSKGNTESIFAVRYAADGVQLGSPLLIDSVQRSTGQTNGAWIGVPVSVSINDSGQAIVGYSKNTGIYTARISSAGVVATPKLIAAPQNSPGFSDDLFSPAVSIDNAGGYFVGWIDDRSVIDGSEAIDNFLAQMKSFNAADDELGSILLGGASDDRGYPEDLQIAANAQGTGAVFAYTLYNFNDDSFTDQIIYGRTSTTALLDPSMQALNDVQWSDSFFQGSSGQPIDDADEPSITLDAGGTFTIGYRRFVTRQTKADPTVQAAYAQRFGADGAKLGDPIALGDTLVGEGIRKGTHSPSVAATPDGGFVVSFAQTVGDTDTFYARRYDAEGVADSSGVVPIASRAAQHFTDDALVTLPRPVIAADDGGRAQIAYIDPSAIGRVQRLSSNRAELDKSVFYGLGTPDADDVGVAIVGSNVLMTFGNESQAVAVAKVRAIDVSGFGGDDAINNATSFKATLRGGEGNDTIFGGAGEDRLHGGVGNDSLWGNDGADKIFGEDGRDYLYGNGGNDRIEGGAQGDFIRGNGGRDRIFGNGGNDRIFGGASGDYIYGQAGRDLLSGEGGNDRLYGDDGFSDTISGGAGDDVLITLDSAVDQVNGDGGHDSANADPADVLASIEVTE